ncbi:hypothetical protein TREMEDRAFT_43846 [Tremella mesenterica DSM 1558]|uniref:uncharacterized protein n=1 Tax=Tremella mesenterica (strain ATCC 24925 / CBS 8224 / DSM 1558 / NBRC 9311 / NRRL Y-6157 / RJB 2259-6 / UBC 559-6) TaxID=578456 RepID=UPI0003F49ACB|nr:uncharacterized protein TREMEDRAFT_43846 [Tremella mesenterica DSM 1558]EIW70265.1 hypothetical protein TREMEDRAFT_43846 [Tremella mesenterica DSM 1558]
MNSYIPSTHPIDARAIITLIVFFVVNTLVIWPIYIPLPLFFPRIYDRLLGRWIQNQPTTPILSEDPLQTERREIGQLNDSDEGENPQVEKKGNSQVEKKRNSQVEKKGKNERWCFPLGLSTAPVIGVLLLLASTCIPGNVVRDGIVGSGGVRPYDIMVLFTAFAYISISLDHTGLLRYLAFLVASRTSTSGTRLHLSFYIFFVLIGLGVGNDPLILSGTPFLAYFTSHASLDPSATFAFLFAHFQSANLTSALLVSSNPTNLVLTQAFGISFLRYSAWLALPTVSAAIVLYPILRWVVFKGCIPKKLDAPKVNAREALVDPWGALFGAVLLIVTIILLVGLSAGGLLEGTEGVWTITAPAAGLMILRDCIYDLYKGRRRSNDGNGATKKDENNLQEDTSINNVKPKSHTSTLPIIGKIQKTLPTFTTVFSRLPLPLLPFAFSMFILVEALQYVGWIRVFGGWWVSWAKVGGMVGCVWLMGILSVLGCNVFGTNIGATVLLSRIIQSWQSSLPTPSSRSLYATIFSLALGSNLGAYSLVFSASLAGLLWRDILSQRGIQVTVKKFSKSNFFPVGITMLIGCVIVIIEVCVIY